MFSGHTVTITTLILLINEYTPKRWILVHTLVWIVGLFGIFFILAGHGHYTLDVIVAFYITSRLFQYHHILANNKTLMTRDQSRLKKWFPVFYFFESNCDGIVPNEYEWPLTIVESAMQRCAKLRNSLVLKNRWMHLRADFIRELQEFKNRRSNAMLLKDQIYAENIKHSSLLPNKRPANE
ncbi:SAMD8 [Mytilus coruscus]|uniref:SAMD8 n=1 Tax=Mytilus coruscus TaxID=42192 RepID=A0A6J8DKR5_MYTCO|nr:SAMD8 [Mytilus coruscus]